MTHASSTLRRRTVPVHAGRRLRPSGWAWAAWACATLVLVPLAAVMLTAMGDSEGALQHLVETRLLDYVVNTVLLTAGVTMIATVVGVSTAWIVTEHDFPGRRIVSWALIVPLAVPSYIAAYAMADLLQFSGPVQTWMRGAARLTRNEYWFPNIRSLGGACFILGFGLYPYVYLAARAAFAEQSRAYYEAGLVLGHGPLRSVLRIVVPIARPAIVAAVLLVVMETVGEFGAVQHCGVDTFATGIYRTWIGLGSLTAAAQLSMIALAGIAIVILVDALNRRGLAFHNATVRGVHRHRRPLGRAVGTGTLLVCAAPVLCGAVVPVAYLALLAARADAVSTLVDHTRNTALVAAAAATLAVCLGVVLAYAPRISRRAKAGAARDLCRLGYAIPGPIVAIGVLVSLAAFDRLADRVFVGVLGSGAEARLWMSGTVVALLLAYQTRFLSIAISMIDGGFLRQKPSIADACATLGVGPFRALTRVHLPAMKVSLLVAGLLVFVDVAKELPATLILRPFNFDTIAVRVYHLAADERLEQAAPGALVLVALGFVAIVVLHLVIERQPTQRATRDDV